MSREYKTSPETLGPLKGPENTLLDLLAIFPEEQWNWSLLSSNPNITWDFVATNLDKDWYWPGVSANPNITWDIIRENPELPWSGDGLSSNPNINWDIVQSSFEDENLDLTWNWSRLSENPAITLDVIQSNPEEPWDWQSLSWNPNLTWDFILANLDKNWDWNGISANRNITLDIVRENPGPFPEGKNWSSFFLSTNVNITPEIILANPVPFPGGYWDREGLSGNPNITLEFIQEPFYGGQEWNLNGISRNRNITWDIIVRHPEGPLHSGWDWYGVSANPNINLDVILSNPDIPWSWKDLSGNKFDGKQTVDEPLTFPNIVTQPPVIVYGPNFTIYGEIHNKIDNTFYKNLYPTLSDDVEVLVEKTTYEPFLKLDLMALEEISGDKRKVIDSKVSGSEWIYLTRLVDGRDSTHVDIRVENGFPTSYEEKDCPNLSRENPIRFINYVLKILTVAKSHKNSYEISPLIKNLYVDLMKTISAQLKRYSRDLERHIFDETLIENLCKNLKSLGVLFVDSYILNILLKNKGKNFKIFIGARHALNLYDFLKASKFYGSDIRIEKTADGEEIEKTRVYDDTPRREDLGVTGVVPEDDKASLELLGITALKEIAKSESVSGYTKFKSTNRDELIQLILQSRHK